MNCGNSFVNSVIRPAVLFRSLKRPYLSFGIFQYAPYKSHYIFILLYNFYNISECFLLYLKLPFLWTLWKWSCTALAGNLFEMTNTKQIVVSTFCCLCAVIQGKSINFITQRDTDLTQATLYTYMTFTLMDLITQPCCSLSNEKNQWLQWEAKVQKPWRLQCALMLFLKHWYCALYCLLHGGETTTTTTMLNRTSNTVMLHTVLWQI